MPSPFTRTVHRAAATTAVALLATGAATATAAADSTYPPHVSPTPVVPTERPTPEKPGLAKTGSKDYTLPLSLGAAGLVMAGTIVIYRARRTRRDGGSES
ncbi:LPXTG cell wall anchor domain-containing protein [Streptomyces sp. NBC_01465]|uniref:LPXTG cell wall anchor domain-containing protein n=1 Tax=Streptomyces sp. NBC_01465 TaxID=2903878 RepID=UPI002E35D0B8|nr:LPXTG cell wall anchor domain-containing protein [Streptomyces sp. NBC_01465]